VQERKEKGKEKKKKRKEKEKERGRERGREKKKGKERKCGRSPLSVGQRRKLGRWARAASSEVRPGPARYHSLGPLASPP
jgi:hypothetical protein